MQIERKKEIVRKLHQLSIKLDVNPLALVGPVYFFTGEKLNENVKFVLMSLVCLPPINWNRLIPDCDVKELILKSQEYLQENFYATNY